jgi:hypothetical protein
MTIKELTATLNNPMVGRYQKRIIHEVLFLAKLLNVDDTDQINPAAIVAIVSKEVIND